MLARTTRMTRPSSSACCTCCRSSLN
jgi:hypothetical protein